MSIKIPIKQWASLDIPTGAALLLGNGSSMALHEKFNFPSLLDAAKRARKLGKAEAVFEKLRTSDFEFVLRVCWHAYVVNEALGNPSSEIQNTYELVRDALIGAVRQVHCLPSEIQDALLAVGKFASSFSKIITLNYDLTMYWAMLLYNTEQKANYFKDAFIKLGNTFEENWPYLLKPLPPATTSTLVFYGHGSLLLARDEFRQEHKIVANDISLVDQTALLDTIFSKWQSGSLTPLFVSEGTSHAKLTSIRNSRYLSHVYDKVFPSLDSTIVAYGLSFAENDMHIVEAIAKSHPKRLVVSVFSKMDDERMQKFCHGILERVGSF